MLRCSLIVLEILSSGAQLFGNVVKDDRVRYTLYEVADIYARALRSACTLIHIYLKNLIYSYIRYLYIHLYASAASFFIISLI